MKRHILLLLCAIISLPMAAETNVYFTAGTQWNEAVVSELDADYCRIEHYRISGDTTLNGIAYHKVYLDGLLLAALRESDRQVKVFDFDRQEEKLLYDFAWEEGKEISFELPGTTDSWTLTLTDIKQMQLPNGEWRNYIDLSEGLRLIQGIGFSNGIFRHFYGLPSNGDKPFLLCFTQNDELLYRPDGYDDCESCQPAGAGIRTTHADQPICVEGNRLVFHFGQKQTLQVNIYNAIGQLVKSAQTGSDTAYELDFLHTGAYYYIVTAAAGQQFSGKFIAL